MIGALLLVPVGFSSLPCPAARASPRTPVQRAAVLARIDSLHAVAKSDTIVAAIDSLVASARAEGDAVLLLGLLRRQGGICAGVGQARRGEELLREALTLAQAVADTPSTCYILRWLGVAVASQGRREEARELSQHLLVVAAAAGDEAYQGLARIGLGWQALNQGCTEEAVSEFRLAAELCAHEGTPATQAMALNGLSAALTRLGSYEEAMLCARRAAQIAEHIELEGERSYALNAILNNLATLEFSRGDPGAAEEHFRQAEELHRQSGNSHAAITPALNLAICQTYLGHHEDALHGLAALAEECEQQGFSDLLGKVLNQMALVRHLQGREHDAAHLFRRSLALGAALPVRNSVEARIGLARALARMDSSLAALAVLEDGAQRLQGSTQVELNLGLRSHLGLLLFDLDRRQEALEHLLAVGREEERLGLRRFRVEALANAARICRAQGRPDSAWTLLQEAMRAWEADRALPLNPEWREQRGANSALLSNQVAALLLEHPAEAPEAQRTRAAFDALQGFKARTLLERMLGPGEALVEACRSHGVSPATVAELQSATLQPGELLLDAFLGDQESYLFAVTRTECRVVRLPPEAELAERLRRYYEMVSRPPRPEIPADTQLLNEIGARLGAQILSGIEDLVAGATHVLFAPDAELNLLPLWALPPVGSPAPPSPGKEFVRIPSATFLAMQRGQRSSVEPPAGAASLLAVAATKTELGEALPGGVQEVRGLARRYRNVATFALGGESASVSITDLMARYDVLHLAAHTRVDDQYPWRSSIRFYPGDRPENPRADQIATMKLPARLAVLSSCETAGGRILSLEGVQGLSSAFLSAGVPAVIASLWPVGDQATARLMERFYVYLAEGQTVAGALRRAQEAVRRDPQLSHPFFWAGFTVVGNGEARVRLERRRNWLLDLGLGVAILMLAATSLAVIRIRRRGQRPCSGSSRPGDRL